MSHDILIEHLVERADLLSAPARSEEWTDGEFNKLRAGCAALMTDLEIAINIGRSEVAVHLKRERLGIPTVRNTPGWISANKLRLRLGMNDCRPIIGWVQKGLVLGRSLPQAGTCWMLQEISLRRFVTKPENWPYFDIKKVRDPHLRRLIALKKERWNDEWLTTRQAADLVGANLGQVKLHIKLGRLNSIRTYNKVGRQSVHEKPTWSYNYVRRSQVLAAKWDYTHSDKNLMTAGGLAWIRRALALGWNASQIARSMKLNSQTVRNYIERYVEKA